MPQVRAASRILLQVPCSEAFVGDWEGGVPDRVRCGGFSMIFLAREGRLSFSSVCHKYRHRFLWIYIITHISLKLMFELF